MLQSVAKEVRRDIAPRVERYVIRVREGRDGMTRPVSDAFKEAVRLTKRAPAAACDRYAQLAAGSPPHPSIAFNQALCAEQRGDYAHAADGFAHARSLLGKRADDIDKAIDRVRRLQLQQAEERGGAV